MTHEIQEFTASNARSYYPETGLKLGSSYARLERPDWLHSVTQIPSEPSAAGAIGPQLELPSWSQAF